MSKEENYLNALVAIYDYLKLTDNEIINNNIKIGMLELNEETLSEMFFRKLKAYDIDLNEELGWTHLTPIKQNKDDGKGINITRL